MDGNRREIFSDTAHLIKCIRNNLVKECVGGVDFIQVY